MRIADGVDERVAGPFLLTGRGRRVGVGFLPGVRAIPPDTGFLEGDPIQFGYSDILSFSPLGTATPGTFYLAGEGIQGGRLAPCTPHVLRIDGLRDGRGRAVPPVESRFVSGPVAFGDIAET